MNVRYVVLGFGVLGAIIFFITHLHPSRKAETPRRIQQETTENVYEQFVKHSPSVETTASGAALTKPTYQTPGCAWEHYVVRSRVSLWGERCMFETIPWTLQPDVGGDSLILVVGGHPERLAVQVFSKPAAASIDALKEKIHPPKGCTFLKNDAQSVPGRTVFELMPTGDLAAQFHVSEDETVKDPCGNYGISTKGQRVFEIWEGHEDLVLFLNHGQDGSLFDYDSIRIQ